MRRRLAYGGLGYVRCALRRVAVVVLCQGYTGESGCECDVGIDLCCVVASLEGLRFFAVEQLHLHKLPLLVLLRGLGDLLRVESAVLWRLGDPHG